ASRALRRLRRLHSGAGAGIDGRGSCSAPPALPGRCSTRRCSRGHTGSVPLGAGASLMFRVDVTWLGYFMALVSLYYVALFLLSSRFAARRDPPSKVRPGMALIVPAHNEETVLGGTLDSLTRLDYDPYRV